MAYEHIQPLAASDHDLADSEMSALARVIENYRQFLPAERWQEYQVRLAREWAIETGQIEGLYHFDRGVTMTLIEEGFTVSRVPATASQMSPEQVTAILHDHLTTLEGLFAFVKGERALSKSYIHELHQALLRNQKTHPVFSASTQTFFEKTLVSGRYKDQPNSPTRPDGSILEFCPPEQVEAEMDQLIAIQAQQEAQGVPVELRAAWLHHAFTHIHPYPDGNGRVARALATLVLIKAGLMPLVVPTAEKQRTYIPALEAADKGDYRRLVAALRWWQGRLIAELSQRIEFNLERKEAKTIDEAIEAVKIDMLRNDLTIPDEWKRHEGVADQLFSSGENAMENTKGRLAQVASSGGWEFRREGQTNTPLPSWLLSSFERSVVEPIRQTHLTFATTTPCHLILRQAKLGPRPRGLALLTVAFKHNDTEDLLGDPFLVNFAEDPQAAQSRFASWLNPAIAEAIERWRRLNF